MGDEDGHSRRTVSSGDLIHATDGTALIVLGIPRKDETVGHLLDGTLVVLDPQGRVSLHLPLIPAPGKPPLVVPWDLGWEPVINYDPVPAPPPPRGPAGIRAALLGSRVSGSR